MKKIRTLSLIGFAILITTSPATATNGAKLIGVGGSSPIMGGTGLVEPQDTGSIHSNPAAVSKLGNRIDFSNELAIIDLKIDTAPAAGGAFANPLGIQKSKGEVFFAPNFGFSNQAGDDSNLYYGFAMGVTSGLKADFKNSRITFAANAFDKHIESATIEFTPAVAYKPTEKLAIGFSPVFTLKYLLTDLSTVQLTRTMGASKYQWATGGGFNLGAIYDITEHVSVAYAFQSPRWMSPFHDYEDTIHRLNGAPINTFGIAVKPNDKLLFEFNAKYIQWTWVKILKESPARGGFGWQDQWVFGIGTQYQIAEQLKLRAGYNYGRSPVRSNNLFANAISPLITEHHLGLGFRYDMTEQFNIDVVQ